MNSPGIAAEKNTLTKANSSLGTKIFLGIAFLLGFAIRFIQYITEPSMWKDELFSIVNIESMSMLELLTQQPAYNQVAGVGFYIIQKTVYLLGGVSTEMVFRFYPFIASIVAMWLFYLIARKFLQYTKLVMAVFLMAASLGPFFQSFNAKPYSGDIMFVMFFVWVMLTVNERIIKTRELWIYGLIGLLGAMASLPALAFAFFATGVLAWKAMKERELGQVMPMFILWITGAVLNILYIKFALSSGVSSAMAEHHVSNLPPLDGVLPYLLFFPQQLLAVLGEFIMIGTDPFNPIILVRSVLLVLLSLVLIIPLIKTKRLDYLILFLPVICLVGLVAFHIMPMLGRTSFYGLWPLILLPFIALQHLQKQVRWVKNWLSNSIAIILVLPSILIVLLGISSLPIEVEPVKKVLSEYKEKKQEGDILYVHGAGDLYMQYYAPKMGVDDYILGQHYADVPKATYASDLVQLHGNKRVWFYFVGFRPEMNPELNYDDIKAIFEGKAELVKEEFMGGTYPNFLNLYDFSEK